MRWPWFRARTGSNSARCRTSWTSVSASPPKTRSASLFEDCDIGAIPPIGAAYDVPVILDESLGDAADIYFEGGDHKTLVHVSGKDFRNLTSGARLARFSHPA